MNDRGQTPILLERVPRHTVVLVSGGLDSATLVYLLAFRGARLSLLSFNYGQRHRRELESAATIARRLDVPWRLVEMQTLGRLLSGSALTDEGLAVPDGRYTDPSMRATVVPNRNALLLDVAVGCAVAQRADAVAFGAHAGDHPIYPDCRPEFVQAYAATAAVANEGFLPADFQVLAPFLTCAKAEIVRLGADLGVPFADTWPCYRGEAVHCGTCGTCVERRETFALARVPHPTRSRGTQMRPAARPQLHRGSAAGRRDARPCGLRGRLRRAGPGQALRRCRAGPPRPQRRAGMPAVLRAVGPLSARLVSGAPAAARGRTPMGGTGIGDAGAGAALGWDYAERFVPYRITYG